MRMDETAEALGHAVSPRVLLPLALLTSGISRRRPRWFGSERRRSFPSGHSSASSAYFLASALTARREHRTPALGLALAGIAAVDTTRVVAHEHWISDVLAGDVVGAVAVAVAEAIVGNLAGMRG
jgi:membrane-associated phospholipid phosphatase